MSSQWATNPINWTSNLNLSIRFFFSRTHTYKILKQKKPLYSAADIEQLFLEHDEYGRNLLMFLLFTKHMGMYRWLIRWINNKEISHEARSKIYNHRDLFGKSLFYYMIPIFHFNKDARPFEQHRLIQFQESDVQDLITLLKFPDVETTEIMIKDKNVPLLSTLLEDHIPELMRFKKSILSVLNSQSNLNHLSSLFNSNKKHKTPPSTPTIKEVSIAAPTMTSSSSSLSSSIFTPPPDMDSVVPPVSKNYVGLEFVQSEVVKINQEFTNFYHNKNLTLDSKQIGRDMRTIFAGYLAPSDYVKM